MIGEGRARPGMVVAAINAPRAVWSIAEIEYYGLSGRDWNDEKDKNEAKKKGAGGYRRTWGRGQGAKRITTSRKIDKGDRRTSDEGGVSFAN